MNAGELAAVILETCGTRPHPDSPVAFRDVFIEHRITSGTFRFRVLGCELSQDGRAVLILTDGSQIDAK